MRLLATTPEADLARLPIAVDLRAISLAEGVRAALSIAAIVAADQWLHWPPLLEAALGALLTCLGDSGGPIRRRLPALLAFALLGAASPPGSACCAATGWPWRCRWRASASSRARSPGSGASRRCRWATCSSWCWSWRWTRRTRGRGAAAGRAVRGGLPVGGAADHGAVAHPSVPPGAACRVGRLPLHGPAGGRPAALVRGRCRVRRGRRTPAAIAAPCATPSSGRGSRCRTRCARAARPARAPSRPCCGSRRSTRCSAP